MPKYLLTISYDGAAYEGWQSQPSKRGVQDQVEKAIQEIFQTSIRIEGAGRTDSGVHAHAMPAHFELPDGVKPMDPEAMPLALNRFLPDDVRVMSAGQVSGDFHARFDARGKEYRYRIWNHPVMHPLHRQYAWHVPRVLDLKAMQEAAVQLQGTHDFRAFTITCPGDLKDSVRTLHQCAVQKNGEEITVAMQGDGFLYRMCRVITGLLVQVGEGRVEANAVTSFLQPEQLNPEDRAGMCAPAHGLSLWQVFYEQA